MTLKNLVNGVLDLSRLEYNGQVPDFGNETNHHMFTYHCACGRTSRALVFGGTMEEARDSLIPGLIEHVRKEAEEEKRIFYSRLDNPLTWWVDEELDLVPRAGIEPATDGLKVRYSTTELPGN